MRGQFWCKFGFRSNQNVWVMRVYGLREVWVKRGSTVVCMSFCKFGGFVNITLMHHTQYKKNLFLAYHITTCSTTSTMSKKSQGSNLSVNLSSFKKNFF